MPFIGIHLIFLLQNFNINVSKVAHAIFASPAKKSDNFIIGISSNQPLCVPDYWFLWTKVRRL